MLLTLLKSQSSKVCGACPADQVLLPGGRCVPRATIAYGQRSSETTAAATAPKEVLPWQAPGAATSAPATKPLFTPLPTSVVSTEPLPGRMAIGGPATLPPVDSVYAPPNAGNGAISIGSPGVAPAAVGPGPTPVASSAPTSKSSKSYKRSRHEEGPGTPHYNLMLSLGGVY